MKNLLGLVVLGFFLYVIMGGNMPSITHYLDDSMISYDTESVGDDDVFVGLHVTKDENGSSHVRGISHRGILLVDQFWSGIFQRDPAVQRSYLVANDQQEVPLPCDVSFVDIGTDTKGQAVDLLGDLCVVDGVSGSKFYPQNHIRRGSLAKMVAGAMMYVYQGDASFNEAQSSYDDVPEGLQASVAQLELWGMGDVIARDEGTFGTDDILTRSEVTQVLESMVASLPDSFKVNDSIPVPLYSGHVTRDTAAHMLVHVLNITRDNATSMLAVR